MSTGSTPAFSDNWAYLRTELSWLDRVLMMAVARYRQDKRSVDRIAQNHADQASSHWWKGIVSLDGQGAYDEHRKVVKPTNTSAKVGYHQQLEGRIQASQTQGIVLALPTLRDRLSLTPFEKNAVLIGLAPEVNRRYARLYRYLQGQSDTSTYDLPTVELILRLLCRNDNEWRAARQTLAEQSALVQRGLLTLLQQPYDTMLTASLKLSEPLVRYLLAESPTARDLDALLQPSTASGWPSSFPFFTMKASTLDGQAIAVPDGGVIETQPASLPSHPSAPFEFSTDDSSSEFSNDKAGLLSPKKNLLYPFPSLLECVERSNTSWEALILPEPLKQDIRHLCHRVRYQSDRITGDADDIEQEPAPSPSHQNFQGTIAVLAGASGTGKSLAVQAIATDLQTPFHWVDLSAISTDDHAAVLADAETVPVLLVKSAHYWLSSAYITIEQEELRQFFSHRRSNGRLTLFTVHHLERVSPQWIDEVDYILNVPCPDAHHRYQLWEKALSECGNADKTVELDKTIDLKLLQTLTLAGGAIRRIVEDGAIAASVRQTPLTLDDIQETLRRQGHTRALRQLNQALARSKKKTRRSRRRSP
ncbi:MAG: AAA family ATPase [Leptolyngbyaceae bacterium]|nr:AAA family ATPase [Leptolyngbyaceae bacterium]